MTAGEGATSSVESRAEGRVPVLTLTGTLGEELVEPLLQEIRQAVRSGTTLVMQLSGVAAADSAGIGGLIRGLKLARDAGGDLVLAGLSQPVARLLDETGLDAIFRVYPDSGTAARAVRPREQAAS